VERIIYVRRKADGGPGYEYSGGIYKSRLEARLARLLMDYEPMFMAVKQLRHLLGNDDDYLDRIVVSAEAVIDGKLRANYPAQNGIVATVASSNEDGHEYTIRHFKSYGGYDVYTCDCEGYQHITPKRFVSGHVQSYCRHILAYLLNAEVQNAGSA
jgi:hypothetical protein